MIVGKRWGDWKRKTVAAAAAAAAAPLCLIKKRGDWLVAALRAASVREFVHVLR